MENESPPDPQRKREPPKDEETPSLESPPTPPPTEPTPSPASPSTPPVSPPRPAPTVTPPAFPPRPTPTAPPPAAGSTGSTLTSMQPPKPAAPGGASPGAIELLQRAPHSQSAQILLKQAGQGKPVVDKYFGSKLPPVCRQLGCYVTDDGKFFYCINPHCHKDKKRETKYNRRKKNVIYFYCPKCKSREIQLHLKKNHYECLDCAFTWKH